MESSICNSCGQVIRNVVGWQHKYCPFCGELLFPNDSDGQREYSLYDLTDLKELVNAAIPENFYEMTLPQLSEHVSQTIWERVTSIDVLPTSCDKLHQLYKDREQQLQGCIKRDEPPPLVLPGKLERREDEVAQYHLVWVNGLAMHVSWTIEEVEANRPRVAESYYVIVPCDCDRVKSLYEKSVCD